MNKGDHVINNRSDYQVCLNVDDSIIMMIINGHE